MNRADLLQLISLIDTAVKNYASDFVIHVKPIELVFDFTTHNTQEFTNAHYVSNLLACYFKEKFKSCFFVRELPISYERTENVVNMAKKDIDNYKKPHKTIGKEGNFSIDAYYQTEINVESDDESINDIAIKHLFVEYKVSRLFKYIALAEDFIKYKIYTSKNEKDTAFAFLCFDKNVQYPTILKNKNPDYILLTRELKESMFSRDDRVFLYLPRNDLSRNDGQSVSQDNILEKSHKLLKKITKITDTLDDEDINKGLQNSLLDNFYCNNIGAFKSNVSTAQLLTKNYNNFIFPLYEYLVNNKKIKKEYEIDDLRLKEIKKKFANYERNIYGSLKNSSLRYGLTSNYKSSFNILVLFNFLAIENQINIKPELKIIELDTEGNKLDYSKTLIDRTRDVQNDKNNYVFYETLGYDILVFIVKLYKVLFIFEENGDYKYSKDYTLFESSKRIQKLFIELRKLIDYKKEINIYGKDIENETIGLFNYIYNYFTIN